MELKGEFVTLDKKAKGIKWIPVKKWCYKLSKEDQKYLFGKGSDGGVNFCKKAIWLYKFYEKNKGKLPKKLKKKIERLNAWNDRISPMNIPQERQWLLAYEKLKIMFKEAGIKGVKK